MTQTPITVAVPWTSEHATPIADLLQFCNGEDEHDLLMHPAIIKLAMRTGEVRSRAHRMGYRIPEDECPHSAYILQQMIGRNVAWNDDQPAQFVELPDKVLRVL